MEDEKKMIEPLPEEIVEGALNKPKKRSYKALKDKKSKRKTATEEFPEGQERHILTQKRLRALEKARVKLAEKRAMEKMKKEEIHKTPLEEVKTPSVHHVEKAESVSRVHGLDALHESSVVSKKNMSQKIWD